MDRLQQTICALATPPGTGGIAVVRVSGPDAYSMVEKIFVPLHVGRKVAEAKGYTAMLGHYLLHGQEMDETIALFFRAPHSYTGEDVIELSVHGGTAMADGLLEALITAGTAPAGPGEFTRRALEHGRMSLTQAEAVMEVIAANGRTGKHPGSGRCRSLRCGTCGGRRPWPAPQQSAWLLRRPRSW